MYRITAAIWSTMGAMLCWMGGARLFAIIRDNDPIFEALIPAGVCLVGFLFFWVAGRYHRRDN